MDSWVRQSWVQILALHPLAARTLGDSVRSLNVHILPFYDSSYNLLRAEEWGSMTFCSLKDQWICSLVNSQAAAFAKSHTTHIHTHTHEIVKNK